MEPDEGLEKVKEAQKICIKYKEIYHDRRTHLSEYFKGDQPLVPWEFQSSMVFNRFDQCVHQLKVIEVHT